METHSYTVALMLIGIRDFPNQMGPGAGAGDFTAEAKFGVDWLLKMWDDSSRTLYYQVGNPADFASHPNILGDHDVWRLPQVDDTLGGNDPTLRFIRHRPVFLAGRAGSKISPNLAGRLAASFAGCYQVFHQTHPNYAGQCLAAAEHVFDLADPSPSGGLLTVAPFDDYGETEWRDDMELGATELYFALRTLSQDGAPPASLPHSDPGFYLKAAAEWAHAYITGPNDNTDTLNLYDVSGLAHFELYRAISVASDPDGLAVSKSDLLKDLKLQLARPSRRARPTHSASGIPGPCLILPRTAPVSR